MYELAVETARLLDFYGGAATVAPEEYYGVQLQPSGGGDALLQA